MEFMAGALKSLMENLHLSAGFITGHSLGGYVALLFLNSFGMLSGYCLSIPSFADRPEALAKREREIKWYGQQRNTCNPDNLSRCLPHRISKNSVSIYRNSKDIAATKRDEGIIAILTV